MESIPYLTIHQLESFFPIGESEKELIFNMLGGNIKA